MGPEELDELMRGPDEEER